MKTLTVTITPHSLTTVRACDGVVYQERSFPLGNRAYWELALRQNAAGLHHFDRDGNPVFEFTLDAAGYRTPVLSNWHVVGRNVGGERHKFARVFDDREYDDLLRRRGYFPSGWAGFHGGTADIVRIVQMPIIQRQVRSPRQRTLRTDPVQSLRRFDERGA